mmetsp:Transcript_66570/g.134174  ORF Transcript_66570/g.134174 Transcript_66570/m.134174 type:complete len:166 (-) Transcript_66570:258-755(-)
MESMLNQSLEDIIKSKPARGGKGEKGANGGGKGIKAGKGGKGKKTGGPVKNTSSKIKSRAAAVPYKAPIKLVTKGKGGGGGSGLLNRLGGKASNAAANGTMVIVANLATDIIAKDVLELFGTVGEVVSAKVIFQNGRSSGKAQVVFAQQSKVTNNGRHGMEPWTS